MKASKLALLNLLLLLHGLPGMAGEEIDRLLAEYANIETVTCQIRRTKEGGLGKMKFLSRVYWTNDNKLHAEGIAPIKRRTIVNGKQLWQYVEGDPKGFSRPISDLSENMRISLEMVPGTAMDQILRLKDLVEIKIPADSTAPKRVGIQTESQYVVLRFDQTNRLIGLQFFNTPAMEQTTAQYDFSDFKEAVPGVWVPLTHEIQLWNGETEFSETVKVDRFIANEPVAESLFIPTSFFDKDIDFVDDFEKIYPE